MMSDSKRSHVLLTLGLLFTIGGAARFLPSSLASADSIAPSEEASASHPTDHGDGTGQPVPARTVTLSEPAASACFTRETAELMARDQELIETEKKALEEERLALQAWEARLSTQTEELMGVQDALEARWQEMKVTSDEDIQHLAQMYGSMKPDQAAQIFNQMDPGFAAGFLRELSSEQAGLILASMDTSKAYVVSVQLASMNDDIRRNGSAN